MNHAPSTPARASKGRKWACARAYSRRQRVTSPQKASGRWACGKTSARWRRSARAAPSCHTSWRHTQSTRVARLSSRSRAAMRLARRTRLAASPAWPGNTPGRSCTFHVNTRSAPRRGRAVAPARPTSARKPSARDAAVAAHSGARSASCAWEGSARASRMLVRRDERHARRHDVCDAPAHLRLARRPEADALASKSSP